MKQEYFFKDAQWVSTADATPETFAVLRGHFNIEASKKVTLNVIGLGFFKCYINGECINPDTFLPLSSEYEEGCDPKDEILSARRIYVPQFDITPYVKKGENVIAIEFGGGWYTYCYRTFGVAKVIYCIESEEEQGVKHFVSDTNCRIGDSRVNNYVFNRFEEHDLTEFGNRLDADFDDSNWAFATVCKQVESDYCTTSCPVDKMIRHIPFKKVGQGENGTVYDCGENTCGYPLLEIKAKKGEAVTVYFAEEILPDGKLDPRYIHQQHFTVISDGNMHLDEPQFTWFGFRYLEVVGEAEIKCVKVVHADVKVNSTFECDNITLNWIYNTFIHTMLCNMHTGHPSDCPHLERRGYTGDGQVTCNAVLTTMDGKAFYEKWMQDIADGQDTVSGHVQYTAPYIRSGGGPGGWGCAIVEVPYQMYKHYGDKSVLEKYYHNMLRYIDYLEEHSEFGLVTSDKAGEWCLGDWCMPVILYPDSNISSKNLNCQQVLLPAPFINNYFMIKSLNQMIEIAEIIGKNEDITTLREKAEERKRALTAAYYSTYDSNFIFNANAANAFAIDIGIGNELTYTYLVDQYEKLGYLNTGIFGTDVLIRVLFEKGDGELAVKLLTGDGKYGFERWRRNGATTLHEYWDSENSRSHNHPMFGAPIAYIFEYLLGIRQRKGSVAYSSLVIEPQATSMFDHMSGSITTPNGVVAVSYKRDKNGITFRIDIPEGTEAVLCYNGNEYALNKGTNKIVY